MATIGYVGRIHADQLVLQPSRVLSSDPAVMTPALTDTLTRLQRPPTPRATVRTRSDPLRP